MIHETGLNLKGSDTNGCRISLRDVAVRRILQLPNTSYASSSPFNCCSLPAGSGIGLKARKKIETDCSFCLRRTNIPRYNLKFSFRSLSLWNSICRRRFENRSRGDQYFPLAHILILGFGKPPFRDLESVDCSQSSRPVRS